MEERRTNKELLILLLNNEELHGLCSGICYLVKLLYKKELISTIECDAMLDYIVINRPQSGEHFDESKKDSTWYWDLGKWAPRKAWLEYRINKEE